MPPNSSQQPTPEEKHYNESFVSPLEENKRSSLKDSPRKDGSGKPPLCHASFLLSLLPTSRSETPLNDGSLTSGSSKYSNSGSAIKESVLELLHETTAELIESQGRFHPDPEASSEDNPDLVPDPVGAATPLVPLRLRVVRPNPVKTTPPPLRHSAAGATGGGSVLVAPRYPVNSSNGCSHPTSIHIDGDDEAEISVFSSKSGNSNGSARKKKKNLSVSSNSINGNGTSEQGKSWCQKAGDNINNNHNQNTQGRSEERRRKELARQRRRQQAQCAFPESNHEQHHHHHASEMNSTGSRRSNGEGGSAGSGSHRQQQHQHHQQNQIGNQAATTATASDSRPKSQAYSGTAAAVVGRLTGGLGGPESHSHVVQAPPLFERLYTDEVQEVKSYNRIIENQDRRMAELSRVQKDLEARLEAEVQNRRDLEATLEAREREWKDQHAELVKERDRFTAEVEKEKANNKLLMNTVKRTEQDIHRMLQRKYDQGGMGRGGPIRNPRQTDRSVMAAHGGKSSDASRREYVNQNPRLLFDQKDMKEQAQLRNAKGLILDFFGM